MKRSLALIALGAFLIASGCGKQEKVPTKPEPGPSVQYGSVTPPSEAPAAPVPAAKPAPAPAAAPAAPVVAAAGGAAAPSGKPDASRGAPLYATNCASCHGPKGDGDGPVGAALNPKPAKHSDGALMNAIPNAEVFKAIKEGGAAVGKSAMMAPWGGVLTDDQIWDLVAFVRSLAHPPFPGSVP